MCFNGSVNLNAKQKNALVKLSSSNKLLQKVGLAPVIILGFLYALMIAFQIGEDYIFYSPSLLFALNTLFLTGTGLIAAIISVKSYLTDGSPTLLLLGWLPPLVV